MLKAMLLAAGAVTICGGAHAQTAATPGGDALAGMAMPSAPASAPPGTAAQALAASAPAAVAQVSLGETMQDAGMADMPGMDMPAMEAALGPYPMTREASGTSWQPDASPYEGLHLMQGDWALMFHGMINGVYDNQGGPRGADKAFVAGMLMAMASRPLGDRGRLQLRAMLSPDPFMGPNGYPLLLATGETANGRTPLIDRQHPHDLFMELSATYSYRLSDRASAFLYAGLPGEPAFGPPAFMHRLSIMDSPEAPISHHWVDSMHITEGVLTGGLTYGAFKLEASGFRGREPNQDRYDIEPPRLDSTAIRASVNPTPRLALQVSWARQISPEQLDPDINERRWSASAIYTEPMGRTGFWSTTAIWAQRQAFGEAALQNPALNAWVLESAVHPNEKWTFYGRAEMVDNDELLDLYPTAADSSLSGKPERVGKLELGAIRDFRIARHVLFGIGAQAAWNVVGPDLYDSYGGDRWGEMGFLRLKID